MHAARSSLLNIHMAIYDKRVRLYNPVTICLGAGGQPLVKSGGAYGWAGRFALPYTMAYGEVVNVHGKTATIDLGRGGGGDDEEGEVDCTPPGLTAAAVVASYHSHSASVDITTHNFRERDAGLELAEAWVKTAVRRRTLASIAAGWAGVPVGHPVCTGDGLALLAGAAGLQQEGALLATGPHAHALHRLLPSPAEVRSASGTGNGNTTCLSLYQRTMAGLHPLAPDTHRAVDASVQDGRLNASQALAVAAASAYRITAIRGPPGTGKTKTIAAVCRAGMQGGERLLLLAPSNAATLRMLESLLQAGVKEGVGLLVAQVGGGG